jgi:hypothetical protein
VPARYRERRFPSSGNPLAAVAGDCPRAGTPDQSIPQAATVAAAERQYPMSTDDSQWVTRKDAAVLARCSEDSIRLTQKNHELQTRTNAAKATLLNLDDLVRVGRVHPDDLAAAGSGAECAELARTKEQANQLRTKVGRQGGRLAEREAFLDMLRQQVGERTDRSAGCRRTSSASLRDWRAGARHEPHRPRALRLAIPVAAPDHRSDLVRLCAGEPVALDRVDLIAFVNGSYAGLDPDVLPDNYTLAEIALERFHSHVGTFRRTNGHRAEGIASDLARYVLLFAIELAAARPAGAASPTCGSPKPRSCRPSCPATNRCRPRPWPVTYSGGAWPSPACGLPRPTPPGLHRRRDSVAAGNGRRPADHQHRPPRPGVGLRRRPAHRGPAR